MPDGARRLSQALAMRRRQWPGSRISHQLSVLVLGCGLGPDRRELGMADLVPADDSRGRGGPVRRSRRLGNAQLGQDECWSGDVPVVWSSRRSLADRVARATDPAGWASIGAPVRLSPAREAQDGRAVRCRAIPGRPRSRLPRSTRPRHTSERPTAEWWSALGW